MVASDFIITRGNAFAGAVSFLFLGITNNELSIPFAHTSSDYQIGPSRYLRLRRYFHLSLLARFRMGVHAKTRGGTRIFHYLFPDSRDESSTRLRKKIFSFLIIPSEC